MADTDTTPTTAPAPAFKKRAPKNLRKRPATPPPDSSSSDDDAASDSDNGGQIKRRKKDGVAVNATQNPHTSDLSKATKYSADRSTHLSTNDDATKTTHTLTSGNTALPPPSQPVDPAAQETGNERYTGASTYGSFIAKHADAPAKPVGPVQAASNVRTITVTDFAPDVCKDYKQTGFCGFGDSCKFLHAREDYKQGWQLDKEWEKVGKNKDKKGEEGQGQEGMDEEERMLEKIPFACVICKEGYKRPVVTKCGHYFCEKCAMGRYMREKKKGCAACGADTGGSFGVAKKLTQLLERKKKRMEERGEEVGEEGEKEKEV